MERRGLGCELAWRIIFQPKQRLPMPTAVQPWEGELRGLEHGHPGCTDPHWSIEQSREGVSDPFGCLLLGAGSAGAGGRCTGTCCTRAANRAAGLSRTSAVRLGWLPRSPPSPETKSPSFPGARGDPPLAQYRGRHLPTSDFEAAGG